jgi:hypothetical protein
MPEGPKTDWEMDALFSFLTLSLLVAVLSYISEIFCLPEALIFNE